MAESNSNIYTGIACFLSGIGASIVFAYLQPKHPESTAPSTPRFTLICHPQIRADQYLLDTQTGRSWKIFLQTDSSSEIEWKEIPVFDSEGKPDKYFSLLKLLESK